MGPIDWLPTLLAKGPRALAPEHLRTKVLPQRPAHLHCIVLDTSGSMQRGARLAQAKGFAARLIEEAARAGDHVALLGFGGQGVELLLPPGPARASGVARVRPLGGGGGTPLTAALHQAQILLQTAQRQSQGRIGRAWLWLLTDGRTREQPSAPQGAAQTVVVDFDDPLRPAGRCPMWAAQWGADYRRPE